MTKYLLTAAAILLMGSSTADAARRYVAYVPGAAPVVYNYWPVGAVYTYPAPAPVVVARPVLPRAMPTVVAPAIPPVVAVPGPAYVVPGPYVYPTSIVVRSRLYWPGRPVRNVVRVVVP